jgi:hypothetical protein
MYRIPLPIARSHNSCNFKRQQASYLRGVRLTGTKEYSEGTAPFRDRSCLTSRSTCLLVARPLSTFFGMTTPASTDDLRSALREIIEGKSVKRSRHDLRTGTSDATSLFLELLHEHRYFPTSVEGVAIAPGERVPAFLVEHGIAHFGWIFWEKFTDRKLRKLFGSAVKNRKGDWEIQVFSQKPTLLYVNTDTRFEMDIDKPSGL